MSDAQNMNPNVKTDDNDDDDHEMFDKLRPSLLHHPLSSFTLSDVDDGASPRRPLRALSTFGPLSDDDDDDSPIDHYSLSYRTSQLSLLSPEACDDTADHLSTGDINSPCRDDARVDTDLDILAQSRALSFLGMITPLSSFSSPPFLLDSSEELDRESLIPLRPSLPAADLSVTMEPVVVEGSSASIAAALTDSAETDPHLEFDPAEIGETMPLSSPPERDVHASRDPQLELERHIQTDVGRDVQLARKDDVERDVDVEVECDDVAFEPDAEVDHRDAEPEPDAEDDRVAEVERVRDAKPECDAKQLGAPLDNAVLHMGMEPLFMDGPSKKKSVDSSNKRGGEESPDLNGARSAASSSNGSPVKSFILDAAVHRSVEGTPLTRRHRPLEQVQAQVPELVDLLNSRYGGWQVRLDALKAISKFTTRQIVPAALANACEPLIPALGIQLQDLRSQIVKQVCMTIGDLAQALGFYFEPFAQGLLLHLCHLLRNAKQVMSSASDDCIRRIVSHTQVSAISLLIEQTTANKSPIVRCRCVEYVTLALQNWIQSRLDLLQPMIGPLFPTICRDSTKDVRSGGKRLLSEYCRVWPDEANAALASLDAKLQKIVLDDYPHLTTLVHDLAATTSATNDHSQRPSLAQSKARFRRSGARKPKMDVEILVVGEPSTPKHTDVAVSSPPRTPGEPSTPKHTDVAVSSPPRTPDRKPISSPPMISDRKAIVSPPNTSDLKAISSPPRTPDRKPTPSPPITPDLKDITISPTLSPIPDGFIDDFHQLQMTPLVKHSNRMFTSRRIDTPINGRVEDSDGYSSTSSTTTMQQSIDDMSMTSAPSYETPFSQLGADMSSMVVDDNVDMIIINDDLISALKVDRSNTILEEKEIILPIQTKSESSDINYDEAAELFEKSRAGSELTSKYDIIQSHPSHPPTQDVMPGLEQRISSSQTFCSSPRSNLSHLFGEVPSRSPKDVIAAVLSTPPLHHRSSSSTPSTIVDSSPMIIDSSPIRDAASSTTTMDPDEPSSVSSVRLIVFFGVIALMALLVSRTLIVDRSIVDVQLDDVEHDDSFRLLKLVPIEDNSDDHVEIRIIDDDDELAAIDADLAVVDEELVVTDEFGVADGGDAVLIDDYDGAVMMTQSTDADNDPIIDDAVVVQESSNAYTVPNDESLAVAADNQGDVASASDDMDDLIQRVTHAASDSLSIALSTSMDADDDGGRWLSPWLAWAYAITLVVVSWMAYRMRPSVGAVVQRQPDYDYSGVTAHPEWDIDLDRVLPTGPSPDSRTGSGAFQTWKVIKNDGMCQTLFSPVRKSLRIASHRRRPSNF